MGNCVYTACMATGKIKSYVLWVTSVGFLVFPLTIITYYLGAPVEATYVIYAIVYVMVDGVRLYIIKGLIEFPVWEFMRVVAVRILLVTIAAMIAPIVLVYEFPQSIVRFIISTVLSFTSAILFSYLLGLSEKERKLVNEKVKSVVTSKMVRK